MKYTFLILKNLRRNLLRSLLTAFGTFMLVLVVTLVWSILTYLEKQTATKKQNLKAVVTERWQLPSQMPFAYANSLSRGAATKPGDIEPMDSMTWQFFGGTLDLKNRTNSNTVFAFCLEPMKLRTMMDELDELSDSQAADLMQGIKRLEENRQGILLGRERLAILNKRIGDRFTLHSINFKGISLEVEVAGVLPPGRYDTSAVMHRDYLNAALEQYKRQNGKPHFLDAKSLNLVWLRVPDMDAFNKIAGQIVDSPEFKAPAVKVETSSSGIAAFLESQRDMIFGLRWLLVPAAIVTLTLVLSNAISLGVRERRTELAVLKVLGFRPRQIMTLVLGESLLLGTLSGLASAGLAVLFVNYWIGGLKFPIAFFGTFYIPNWALLWGFSLGSLTALVGSLLPAWMACRVNVAQVFAKVT